MYNTGEKLTGHHFVKYTVHHSKDQKALKPFTLMVLGVVRWNAVREVL